MLVAVNMKLIIMRGLPASGKSTRAEQIVRETGNTVRINRDLLRTMLHFDKWTPQNEKATVEAALNLAGHFLDSGKNVIIDDTNLTGGTFHSWVDFADDHDAEVQIIDMMKDVTMAECIDRDLAREKSVGPHVIRDMAFMAGYLPYDKLVVCDIDGTIADLTHRRRYAKGPEKNWARFFSLLGEDTPRMDVYKQALAVAQANDAHLVLVSARPDTYRAETIEWLRKYNMMDWVHILMRKGHDKRQDTQVKSDIYDKYLSRYQIIEVFDDRPSVIRMWREKGLNVTDVGNGEEF